MKSTFSGAAIAFFALFALVGPIAAAEFTVGKIQVVEPWSRATPGGAPVAGGYLRIVNGGSEADRLTGGSSPVAGRVTVHEMSLDSGVMKMRPLASGLEVKPGDSVELKPGGYHVMFEQLKEGLKEGDHFKATLVFEKAGPVEVDFTVLGMGALAPPAP